MSTSSPWASSILLGTLVLGLAGPCLAQGVGTPLIEGLWQTDPGQDERWLDIRMLERPKGPLIHAWWTCGKSEACRYFGEVRRDQFGRIEMVGYHADWKSVIRIDRKQDRLIVFEEIAYANGGGGKSSQVLHLVAANQTNRSAPQASILKGGRVLRTDDGRVFDIKAANPERTAPEPPRPSDDTRTAAHLNALRLQPPYSPNDQNLPWVAEYNHLLRQILAVFLSPPNLEVFNTPNEYDNFVRLTTALNDITLPK